MAIHDPRAEQDQAVSANLAQLLRYDPQKLLREDLGPWGFAPIGREIAASFDLAIRLNGANRSALPAKVLEKMNGALASTRSGFEMAASLESSNPSPGDRHAQVVEKIRNTYELLFSAVAPHLPFLEQDVSSFERQRTELVTDLSKALDDLNNKRLEGDRVLEGLRKAATTAGIVGEAQHFSKQADEHREAARLWAIATVLLLIGTAGLALYSMGVVLDGTVAKLDTALGVQLALGKVLLFSILFTAIVGSTRSYRSNRHNYVVNKHRANALGTFQAFVQGASHDPAVKSAVLLQATTCVFTPQPTAYGTREADAAGSQPLVELAVKAMASHEKR